MSTNIHSVANPKYLGLLVLAVSIGAFVLVYGRKSVSSANELAVAEGSRLQAEQQTGLIESEVISVTRRGFEPTAISRAAGKFILMVDNRSGAELNFRFSRETGERIHEIKSTQQELDWNDVVDLRPGRYLLTERDHPDWSCSITITAR